MSVQRSSVDGARKRPADFVPIRILFHDANGSTVPVVTTFEYLPDLLDHEEIDAYIEALKLYKKSFSDKNIQKYRANFGESHEQSYTRTDFDGLLSTYKKTAEPGWVYLIRAIDINLFKIGHSKNPESRLAQLSKQQIPSRLALVAKSFSPSMRILEQKLHKQFADNRTNGEWFKFDEKTLANVVTAMLQSGGSL